MTVAGIPEPIRRSMQILATHRALFGRVDRRGRGARTMTEVDIARVIEIFEAHQVTWVLVGAHAMGLLTEPRATADFDFIIDGVKVRRVLDALREVFGDLDEVENGAAMQLRAIDIDLIRSTNHRLFQAALDQQREVGAWKVPRTEVLVALKFLAAVSPWRDRAKRMQDVTDISVLVEATGARLDRAVMRELAGMAYPGAEREFDELIGKIERGEPIAI